jgi:hypothetical protein
MDAHELAPRYAEDCGDGRGRQRQWLDERQSGGAVESAGKGMAAVRGEVGCAAAAVAIGGIVEAAGPDWLRMAEVSPPGTQSESEGINTMAAQCGGGRSRRWRNSPRYDCRLPVLDRLQCDATASSARTIRPQPRLPRPQQAAAARPASAASPAGSVTRSGIDGGFRSPSARAASRHSRKGVALQALVPFFCTLICTKIACSGRQNVILISA